MYFEVIILIYCRALNRVKLLKKTLLIKKIETLLRKSKKLYDVIPKMKTFRRKTTPPKPLDIQKQNVKTLRYMDYAL